MNYKIRSDDAPSDENWERKMLRDVLLATYTEQRRARIWKNIWRGVSLLLVLFVAAGIAGSRTERHQAAALSAQNHTAVINLFGAIGGGDTDQVDLLRQGMEAVYDEGKAKAILIRADSPGGSPVVANTAFEEIRRLKAAHPNIPVYVVVQDMCASGCYYIAAAADKIYADPSSLVGSIGVVGSNFDLTGLMDKFGVKYRERIAGDNKGMGSPFVAETPQQQAIWQQMLNQIHGEFIKAVKTGRGSRLKTAQFPDLFSGRVYTGLEAKQNGLIDDFGSVYSVARDVVKAPDLVDYTPETDDFSALLRRRIGSEIDGEIRNRVRGWLNAVW